jgi:hypothetical protein
VRRRLWRVEGHVTSAGSPESRAGFQFAQPGRSVFGAAAHLEFHPVGIAEEQRPFITQPLDLADLLGAGDAESLLDRFERCARVDGEGKVVDRAALALTTSLADDLVGGNLEDIERGSTPEVEDCPSPI